MNAKFRFTGWLQYWAEKEGITEENIVALVHVKGSEISGVFLTRDGRVLDPGAEFEDILACIDNPSVLPVLSVNVDHMGRNPAEVKMETFRKLEKMGFTVSVATEYFDALDRVHTGGGIVSLSHHHSFEQTW